jgi:hypothetical protein
MPTFTKKSRPSFSAPKAPIPPDADDLVKNEEPEKPDPVETEVIENDLPQKEDKPDVEAPKDPQKAPTPPAKMVSRTKDEDMESPLEATLKEVKTVPAQEPVESQDEALEPDAEPEEKPEPTKDKVPKNNLNPNHRLKNPKALAAAAFSLPSSSSLPLS